MALRGQQNGQTAPMTLHAIMQASVGMGLQARYKPEQEIPHGLLVLLMQMNADKREAEKNTPSA